MAFRAVNRRGLPDHDPGLQRHHLLPRQILTKGAFSRMFGEIGGTRRRFSDFRENGLLLPCEEMAAARMGMPLHRGPHRHYSDLVFERVGQIEATWGRARMRDCEGAAVQAHMRLDLLQCALRRFLLDSSKRRLVLNRRDPLRRDIDFSDLDAVADAMWGATEADQPMPMRPSSSSLAD
ncbi:AHH domain-containing protein [Novosphingobium sp. HK4-1]|uniref:AHH domain-containing protein n=1 Tax=Novosphingobium mangrovi (ex Huang et al. 2023) TaxID=2976432 RepID=A0ABT2I7R5_9SPHN|nr:AHH domain-containing protein [Novosphingobium mangrovi (ex Huang et al. 2023)]